MRFLLKSQTAPSETAAMVIEPELGEGGYLPAPVPFLRGLEEICREHGILFVADEVQTGFGRTGKMFAVEHYGVQADVIVMAKGLGSGFPISAIGASDGADGEVAEGQPRRHVRRQPDRLRGGAGHDRRPHRARLPRQRATHAASSCAPASPTSPATTAASSTCGAGA